MHRLARPTLRMIDYRTYRSDRLERSLSIYVSSSVSQKWKTMLRSYKPMTANFYRIRTLDNRDLLGKSLSSILRIPICLTCNFDPSCPTPLSRQVRSFHLHRRAQKVYTSSSHADERRVCSMHLPAASMARRFLARPGASWRFWSCAAACTFLRVGKAQGEREREYSSFLEITKLKSSHLQRKCCLVQCIA